MTRSPRWIQFQRSKSRETSLSIVFLTFCSSQMSVKLTVFPCILLEDSFGAWPTSLWFHMCTCTEPYRNAYVSTCAHFLVNELHQEVSSALLWKPMLAHSFWCISRILHALASTQLCRSFLSSWGWVEVDACVSIWSTNGNDSALLKFSAGAYKCQLKRWRKYFTTEVFWLYFLRYHSCLHPKVMVQESTEKLPFLLKHHVLFP